MTSEALWLKYQDCAFQRISTVRVDENKQCGDQSGDTHVDVFCKPRAVKSQAVYTSALFV